MLLNPDFWAFSIRSSFKNLKQVLFVRFKVFAKGIFSHIGKKSPVKTELFLFEYLKVLDYNKSKASSLSFARVYLA